MKNYLVFIEFDKNNLPWVAAYRDEKYRTYADIYDINYSKTEKQFYYHQSGGGGLRFNVEKNSRFWAANDVVLTTYRNGVEVVVSNKNRMKRKPVKYGRPIDDWAIESETTWCNVCQDNLTEDDARGHRHLFKGKHGEWLGVGGTDNEKHDYEEIKLSLFAILRATGIAAPLAKTIRAGKMGFDAIHLSGTIFGYDFVDCYLNGKSYGDLFTHFDYGGDQRSDEEILEMEYGIYWLIGLDNEKTKKANKLTLQWIKEWQKESKLNQEGVHQPQEKTS